MECSVFFCIFAVSNRMKKLITEKTKNMGKKGGKRFSKREVADALQGLFQAHPNETFNLKQIFKALRLDTHPAKMLAVDVLEEVIAANESR